jgi:hypothetical protein
MDFGRAPVIIVTLNCNRTCKGVPMTL